MFARAARRIRIVIAIFTIACAAARAPAADDPSAAVDAYVESQRAAQHIPGLSLLVVKDGQIVKAQGFGLANVEHAVPVKPETVFQSGSLGKQFTATAVMMLMEDGKLALDDPVRDHLPGAPESWKAITWRHLLSHTSGLTNFPQDFDLRRDYSNDELLKAVYAVPLNGAPGERWQYSNPGYVTLGLLIEKVSGKFYGDLLVERVFKPLEMSTRVISESDIVPNRAAGYRLVGRTLKNQEWVSPAMNRTADGSLYVTILDLARWDTALGSDRLLKPASLELMWTPVKLNNGQANEAGYGFGFVRGDVNGHLVIEHGGAWQGFTSYMSRYPDDKLAVAVLANLAAGSMADPGKIVHHVAGMYITELMPKAIKPIEDKEPRVTALLREQLTKLAAGQPELEAYTPEARERISPERVAALVQLVREAGALQHFELIERQDKDGQRLYRYRVRFAQGPAYLCTFRLTDGDKIALFAARPE